ncbi:hypothetical protein [Kytococcus sp. Marseille-QA3725]
MHPFSRSTGWIALAAAPLLLAACAGPDEVPQSHGLDSAAEVSPDASATSGPPAGSATTSAHEDPEPQILDCLGEGTLVRPETLNLDCQDTNATLSQLQWAEWDAGGAKGTGEFSVNNCQPNCAEGDLETYQVEVEAPEVKTSQAGSVYTSVIVEFPDGRPVGSTSRETYELPH